MIKINLNKTLNKNEVKKADAVFEGGGIRGIGIIGAVRCFEKNNYKWMRTAGSSVGAIMASLLVCGYNTKEIEKILLSLDFMKFLDKDRVQKIPVVGPALGLYKEKGIYSGEYFENWMRELLSKKGVRKFGDVSENGQSKLKIIASDITKKKRIVLPDDLIEYSIDPMEFEIARAVRMSISIPFYFKPVEFKYKEGISYMVDGGVTCNYPLDIFDVKSSPKWPTIGFKFNNIGDNTSFTAKGNTDPMAFMFDIAGTMSECSNVSTLSNEDKARTVFIPIINVSSTEFDISRQKAINLFKSGYIASSEFLKIWDFEKYKKMYRNDKNKLNILDKIFKNKK